MKTQLTNHKLIRFGVALFTIFMLQTGFTTATIEINIDVAPAILNLQNKGEVVTIHTDIAYGLVAASTVYLNDIPIHTWKSDDRGFFVAKFLMEDVKGLPLNIGALNTFTMTGETVTGIPFIGSQDIKIMEVIPSGKK